MGTSTVKLNGTTLLSIDDTTATASDVASGKYFYTADGTKTEGTASGGNDVVDWVRPVNAPNLDEITLSSSEDVIYITYDIQYDDWNFCLFKFQGAYQVDIGTVNNGIFTAIEQSESVSSNTLYFKDLSSYKNNYDYIVVKIIGTLTNVQFYNQYYTDNTTGKKYNSNIQPILEIYCSLPHLTSAEDSFRGLCSVERYYIANFSPATIENLFRENYNLKQVDKDNWNTNNLTNCSYVFYEDVELQKFDTKGLVTSATTNISYMFYNCKSISKIDTTDWNTENITTMSNTFRNCINLKTIALGNFNTKKLTSLFETFRSCQSLNNIDLSNWDMSSVTDSSYMFYDCTVLNFIDVSDWDMKNNKNFRDMFSWCQGLYSLDVSNWDTSSATNMRDMFSNSKNLRSLDVSNWDMGSVTSINSMFSGDSLLRVDISKWNLAALTDSDNFMSGCLAPHSFVVPSTFSKIGTNAFNSMINTISEYHFLATTPPTLSNTNGLKGRTPIYVPYSEDHSILNAYKTATNWSSFASYIQEEEP